MNKPSITLELLEEAIKSYFKENPKKLDDFSPKHYTGTNEDGTKYSYWKIGNLITGDGGKELYDKTLLDIFKNPEKY